MYTDSSLQTQIDAYVGPDGNNEFDMPDASQPDRSWLDRNPLEDLDFITRTNVSGTTSLGLR